MPPLPGRPGRAPLRRLERGDLELLREVGRAALAAGHGAWLVGGPVRDLLLGRDARDLDVVVDGDAAALAGTLARSLTGSVRSHARFGTATLRLADGRALDLARARVEVYDAPAALPRVTAGTLLEDLRRRDFTINAIAADLTPRRFGRLVDPLGGRADLRARAVRVLHERSFVDDPTRAWRAVRLSARLGLRIEPRTAWLLRDAVAAGLPGRLSPARLRREVERLLEGPGLAGVAREARRFGLWSEPGAGLAPDRCGLLALRRLERLLAAAAGSARPAVAALWLLLAPHARSLGAAVVARLEPPRGVAGALLGAAADSRRVLRGLARARRIRPSLVRRLCAGLPLEALLGLAALAPAGAPRRALERHLASGREVETEIDGGDLLAAGIVPGPRVARGLDAALAACLDGRADTRREQLRIALRAARRA